ncbi:MAG: InlB B-repeat-containing protein, partial [Actinomycetota bacterium]
MSDDFSPSRINCLNPDTPTPSSDCAGTYDDGDTVTLTAVPDADPDGDPATADGYVFSHWVGCDAPSATTCTVTVDETESVTAFFGHELTLDVIGRGSVSLSAIDTDQLPIADCAAAWVLDGSWSGTCSAVIVDGATVSLTAIAGTGWSFERWSEACTVDPTAPLSCEVTVTQAASVTAYFGRALTLNLIGEGTVTIDDDGVAPVLGTCDATDDGSETCTVVVPDDANLTLEAAAGDDYEFRNFAGAERCELDSSSAVVAAGTTWTAAGVARTCTVTMAGERIVTAYFGRQLDLDVVGSGTVSFAVTDDATQPTFTATCGDADSTACHPVVLNGKTIKLTADSDLTDGYELRNYAGDDSCSETGAPATAAGVKYSCTITLSAPGSAITYFGRQLDLDVVGSGTVSFAADSTNDPDEFDTLGDCVSTGTTTCYRVLLDGTVLTLTASGGTGYELRNYAGDSCTPVPSSTNKTNAEVVRNCTIDMTAPRSAKTYFGRELRLDVTGSGTVGFSVASPDADQPALPSACAATCYGVVMNTKVITLTATPSTNFELRNYAGDTCTDAGDSTTTTHAGEDRVCTITMDAEHSAKTYFGRELALALTGAG